MMKDFECRDCGHMWQVCDCAPCEGFPASPCSVTDSGARILHKEDVILALMEVGLGGKLVNEALLKLGFQLDVWGIIEANECQIIT